MLCQREGVASPFSPSLSVFVLGRVTVSLTVLEASQHSRRRLAESVFISAAYGGMTMSKVSGRAKLATPMRYAPCPGRKRVRSHHPLKQKNGSMLN